MALLEIEKLEVSYGPVRALHGVSISIEEGAMVCLLGANGAGKSTTLKAISGVVKINSGSIKYDGHAIDGKKPPQIVRGGIAQVPEGRKIFKDLSVMENLRMGSYIRKDKVGISDDLEMVLTMFPRLRERTKQLGGSLSGGEQQMLAIGRGLMARPRLLLLDEPSLGLAPLIVKDIFAKLTQLNTEQGTSMLIVEQNANIALRNTAKGYVMQIGKVTLSGESKELLKDRKVVESYMGTST